MRGKWQIAIERVPGEQRHGAEVRAGDEEGAASRDHVFDVLKEV